MKKPSKPNKTKVVSKRLYIYGNTANPPVSLREFLYTSMLDTGLSQDVILDAPLGEESGYDNFEVFVTVSEETPDPYYDKSLAKYEKALEKYKAYLLKEQNRLEEAQHKLQREIEKFNE